MPHLVSSPKYLQRLTRGKSALWLFDILGGIHSKLENYGFHKQTFNTNNKQG